MTDSHLKLLEGLPLYGAPEDSDVTDFDDDSTSGITQLPSNEVVDGSQENGGLVELTPDELRAFYSIVYGAGGATESKLKEFFHSTSRDWDQYCQAGAWNACHQFGSAPVAYASANTARAASKIVGTDPSKAVAGDWHFYAIGTYGHVSGALGGGRTWMCSQHVDVKWGTNVGSTTVDRYVARTGARYLGYAHSDGKNDFSFAAPTPVITADQKHVMKVATWLNAQHLGFTSTAAKDGKRGKVYWTEVQTWGTGHDKNGHAVARSKSLYPAGFDVDGDPGKSDSRSHVIETLLIKAHG